jgi:hypothetical protein
MRFRSKNYLKIHYTKDMNTILYSMSTLYVRSLMSVPESTWQILNSKLIFLIVRRVDDLDFTVVSIHWFVLSPVPTICPSVQLSIISVLLPLCLRKCFWIQSVGLTVCWCVNAPPNAYLCPSVFELLNPSVHRSACPPACLSCPSACLTCPPACLSCPSACLSCPSACLSCPSVRQISWPSLRILFYPNASHPVYLYFYLTVISHSLRSSVFFDRAIGRLCTVSRTLTSPVRLFSLIYLSSDCLLPVSVFPSVHTLLAPSIC